MTAPVDRPVIHMRDIVKTYYIGQPNELEILHGISDHTDYKRRSAGAADHHDDVENCSLCADDGSHILI